MILKRNFDPRKVMRYVWRELLLATILAVGVWFAYGHLGIKSVVLPFAPLGVLGTALAIFLGFRNNNAYARWWEARTQWANIANNTRTLARQVLSSIHNAQAVGKIDGVVLATFAREIVLRQVAWAHALRLHLRNQEAWEELAPLLVSEELAALRQRHHKPNALLQTQSDRLKDGVRAEILGPFDPISIEPNLGALANWAGNCERLKSTPLPRQYDFFTRVFLWAFVGLLAPALLSLFPAPETAWAVVPLTLVITLVYAVVNRTGQVLEDPFENTINDVPLTAICRDLERDLRDLLGETVLPPALVSEDGYLF